MSPTSRITWDQPSSATRRRAVCRSGALSGQDRDGLGDVAVRRGPRHGESSAEQGLVPAFAEPDQHHQRLTKAGQRPGALSGAAGAVFGGQQPGKVVHEFPWGRRAWHDKRSRGVGTGEVDFGRSSSAEDSTPSPAPSALDGWFRVDDPFPGSSSGIDTSHQSWPDRRPCRRTRSCVAFEGPAQSAWERTQR